LIEEKFMASDGTPELATQRCGAAVARLRTLRNLSRAQLVARLYEEIDPSDPIYERINVIWLARLENGRVVKVVRPVVEALCRALRCTPRERAWLLLHADRSVLAGDPPGEPAELLTYVVEQLHREASEHLAALLGSRRACGLDEIELLEITATALEIVLAQRRGERAALRRRNGNDTIRASAQKI
jgi:transcriptional regulator with XRE-family HTH domain